MLKRKVELVSSHSEKKAKTITDFFRRTTDELASSTISPRSTEKPILKEPDENPLLSVSKEGKEHAKDAKREYKAPPSTSERKKGDIWRDKKGRCKIWDGDHARNMCIDCESKQATYAEQGTSNKIWCNDCRKKEGRMNATYLAEVPLLMRQIHPTKNNPQLDYATILVTSPLKLWWKCLQHTTCDAHVWLASVENRAKGTGCKFCAGRETCKCQSFGHNDSQLLQEFIAAGNDIDEAYSTPPGSNKKFSWKCLEHKTCEEHIWRASVNSRTNGKTGCGFCKGNLTCKCQSFGNNYPELLKEFIAAGNEESLAFSISCGSKREFMWKCLDHHTCEKHIWRSSVQNRVLGHGCRFCSGQATCKCQSFGSMHSHLLLEFMHAGGTEIEAFSTSCGSEKLLDWRCNNGHTYPARVNARIRGSGCPHCNISQFEQHFQRILQDRKIKYETQKRFSDCRDQLPLPFDAAFMDDCLGETDGEQHFLIKFNRDEKTFATIQKHDKIKNEFAATHNKHLFRIAYSERSHMEKHFDDFLKHVRAAGTGLDRMRIERFYGAEYGGKNCLLS